MATTQNGIENAQCTLNYLYGIRTAALIAMTTPQADVVYYVLGDRKVEIRSYHELKVLNEIIFIYESIVTSNVKVMPFMGGVSNPPGPIDFGCGYGNLNVDTY